MAKVKVTLVRGLVGTTDRQRATVQSLGLRKIRQFSLHEDSPSLRGQLAKVNHLVKIEEES